MFYIKPQNKEDFFTSNIIYIKVSPTSGCYVSTIEKESQGIVVEGIPYSTSITAPIKNIETAVYEKQENWDEEIKEKYNNILYEKIKEDLILNFSKICEQTINEGSKVQLSDGSEKNFTYDINDQANISEMFNAILMGATKYPYHANDEDCRMYEAQDIIIIYSTLSAYKTAQMTYYNQLKRYIKSLSNIEEIEKVSYGQPLTGQYLETYNSLIEQAGEQLQTILTKASLNN